MKKHLIVVMAVLLMMLATSAAASAGNDNRNDGNDDKDGAKGLNAARAATAAFRDIAVAKAAGYGLLVDAKEIACIDNLPAGGMGIHYVNGDLVGDAKVNARTPEALVYEPMRDGSLRLVALEYVVFQANWDAKHRSAPKLFGQRFELIGADNRYGLDPFYELHVWIWKHNPSGMFEDWNPRVSCRYA
jgi:hypothetical protein